MIKMNFKEIDGKIIDILPNSKFKILLNNKLIIRAYISGRMRKNNIRLLNGDKVVVQLTIYDKNNGRIIMRKN